MKLFVWDFHGVLEKDNDRGLVDYLNMALASHGHEERFDYEEVKRLYGKRIYDFFVDRLPHLPPHQHQKLLETFLKHQVDFSIVHKYIKPTEHAHHVVETIGRKHKQVVISSTQNHLLPKFLDAVQIRHHFPRGHAVATDIPKKKLHTPKKEILKRYLAKQAYDDIVIIGDSPSDIELTSVAGGTAYLYSHPHLPFRDCLPDCQPHYRINDLREVLREI